MKALLGAALLLAAAGPASAQALKPLLGPGEREALCRKKGRSCAELEAACRRKDGRACEALLGVAQGVGDLAQTKAALDALCAFPGGETACLKRAWAAMAEGDAATERALYRRLCVDEKACGQLGFAVLMMQADEEAARYIVEYGCGRGWASLCAEARKLEKKGWRIGDRRAGPDWEATRAAIARALASTRGRRLRFVVARCGGNVPFSVAPNYAEVSCTGPGSRLTYHILVPDEQARRRLRRGNPHELVVGREYSGVVVDAAGQAVLVALTP